MVAYDQIGHSVFGPARVSGEGTIVEDIRREISLVYRFEESPDSGTEFRVVRSNRDHTLTSSVSEIPSGKLLWSETSGGYGPFALSSIEDDVRDCLLALKRLTTRLAKDGAGSD
jgi:hypothetical protein